MTDPTPSKEAAPPRHYHTPKCLERDCGVGVFPRASQPAPADPEEVGTCDTYHGPEVECSWCRKYRPSLYAPADPEWHYPVPGVAVKSPAPAGVRDPKLRPDLAAAAQAYLDAEAVPAYSWVIESQEARAEGRPNREVERMERINAARQTLRAAIAHYAGCSLPESHLRAGVRDPEPPEDRLRAAYEEGWTAAESQYKNRDPEP